MFPWPFVLTSIRNRDHFPKPLEVPVVAISGGNDFVNRTAARALCPSLCSPVCVRTDHMYA